MLATKRIFTILLSAVLCVPAALAQSQQRDVQPNQSISQEVMIIIQQEQVRFTAQKAVLEMRLEVFDQTGDLVYDSGLQNQPELNWSLKNGGDKAIKSGMYAYRLSIREAGADTPRVRKGHFIVDRASEQDGKTDRLWITSQNASIGMELTVASDESSTIAGTRAASYRANTTKRDSTQRAVDDRATDTSAAQTALAATEAAIGTVGQIAKFTSATDLGNSVMAEQNGSIGIGVTSPNGRLHILGNADVAGTVRFQPNANKGTNQSHVHWGATGDWYIRSAAATGKVILQDTGGNVSIGTANPTSSRLTIEGQDALTVRGYQPVFTFLDSSNANARGAIQQVAGGLNLFTESYLSRANPLAYLRLDNNGNLGIGSATPKAKLEVASGSGDILRLIGYEPFITLFDSNRGWTPAYIQNAGGHLVFKPTGFGSCCAAMVMQANTGNIGIGTSNPQAKLDVVGRTRTASLEITGGADFAENFDVNVPAAGNEDLAAQVEAGMVVSIDPASPGKLQLSSVAYDRRVAGIISGAGGVKPGMMMSQAGTLADGQHPVALSGRVYCYVDASQGAIEPGDLLTTSSTPGHAMKATDEAKAQGAIIGKAMTSLKEGKGLVLVLVTLQ